MYTKTPMGEEEAKNNGLVILLGLVLLVFLFKVFDWGFLSSRITEYPAYCKVKVVYNTCSSPAYELNKTVYEVIPARQEVIYTSEGSPPNKLTNCAISDRSNWSCKYSDNSAELGFVNGRYYEVPLTDSSVTQDIKDHGYYLSKWSWLNVSAKYGCGGKFYCYPLIYLLN